MTTSKRIEFEGGSCVIRKLNARDIVKAVGHLPDVVSETDGKKRKGSDDDALKLTEHILLNCIRTLVLDGKPSFITAKPFSDCLEELSLDEFLSSPAAASIVSSVLEFSNMTAADREAARPFPEKQESSGAVAPNGSTLPDNAVRIA